jgi:hypothetical protein
MATSVNRLVGRYAICAVGNTNALLSLTDWQVNIRTEFVDGTGFGDFWDVPVPIKYLWTARARGLYDLTGTLSYLQAYQLAQSGTSDVLAATFVGYVDDSATKKIFQAQGFVERAAFMAPQAMAEQELEIRGSGNPGVIT